MSLVEIGRERMAALTRRHLEQTALLVPGRHHHALRGAVAATLDARQVRTIAGQRDLPGIGEETEQRHSHRQRVMDLREVLAAPLEAAIASGLGGLRLDTVERS